MRRLYVIAIVAVAAVIIGALAGLIFFSTLFAPRCGYVELTEGFLESRAYPKLSETVPTIMVLVMIPKYDSYVVYLTENGLPLASLEGFMVNDLVNIEGVLYSREAVDKSQTYWMLEIFSISRGD